jgi:peptide/nickel transport system substrate-binding protein
VRRNALMALSGVFAILAMVVAWGCGRSSSSDAGAAGGVEGIAAANLPVTSTPGTGEVDKVKWAVYRSVSTLDPIFDGDYPEQTAMSLMCESLLRQEPDGSIKPGLAANVKYVGDREIVLNLRQGVTFWDGSPMTPADVVYSLERERDPELGGFWGALFSSVSSITASGPTQVTIKLSRPDYWMRGALSFVSGIVVEKRYAEAAGSDFGNPGGGTMCTGPYELKDWQKDGTIDVVRSGHYWDSSVEPKVREIEIAGVPDDATLTAGLETGEIDGAYPLALSTLGRLRHSSKVKVYEGRSYFTDAMIVSNFDGVLGDVRVRRALSMALDRESLAKALYDGAASPSRALGTPGQWGYARQQFADAWNALPGTEPNVEAAKRLVEAAGATGKTLTLATSTELEYLNLQATAVSNAAKSIGLKVHLVDTSAANVMTYMIDPKARQTVDGFFTVNISNWADPAAFYTSMALPEGVQNYNGYKNPQVVRLLEKARGTASDSERARLVIEAQKLITRDLPWIPTVGPDTILVMSSDLSGAVISSPYLFAPWADDLGATGG